MGRFDGPAEDGSSWVWDSELRCPECASAVGCVCGSRPIRRPFAASKKRAFQIQLIELAEQSQVLRALQPRLVVVGRARHSQEFALLLDAEAPVRGIDPLPFVVS